MKNARDMRLSAEGLSVRIFPGEFYDDCYAAFLPANRAAAEEAANAFEKLAAWMHAEGVSPMFEKIYARAPRRPVVEQARLAAMRKYGLECASPATFVDGAPPGGGDFGGVQLWGVRSPGAGPVTVDCGRLGRGRLLEAGGLRLIHLSSVFGNLPDGALPAGPGAQARRMFLNARDALKSLDFKYRSVFRTWIYLRRILDWYPEFNQVRNALYPGADFFPKGSSVFPASTGIQGRAREEECFMDVLALDQSGDSEAASLRPILTSSRQGEAFDYGSAFSRGMVLVANGRKTVHVSGTAAIDDAGKTVFAGDPYEQSLATFQNVARLLREQGAGLSDLAQATLFCRSEQACEAALRAAAKLRLSDLPIVPVLADVCRGDLEVELEGIAVV